MIKVIHKSLNILEFLSSKPEGETLSAIASAIGEKPTTVSNIVQVLAKRNYLERVNGRWKLGVSAYMLTGSTMDYDKVLLTRAKPILERLAAETEASAVLSVWRGQERYVLLRVMDQSAVTVNHRYPEAKEIYRTATGMLLLSEQPSDVIEAHIAENGIPGTENPSDEEIAAFLEELQAHRTAGYYTREKESIYEAAASIRDSGGAVRTAVGIFLPLFRANDKPALTAALLCAARELESGTESR
ncbi:MAG: helix-turn-helix domain-containing protein [Clostridia bacterium]|nr:helix-turn-helix domain-containing protein [Clostridia bacterium]